MGSQEGGAGRNFNVVVKVHQQGVDMRNVQRETVTEHLLEFSAQLVQAVLICKLLNLSSNHTNDVMITSCMGTKIETVWMHSKELSQFFVYCNMKPTVSCNIFTDGPPFEFSA